MPDVKRVNEAKYKIRSGLLDALYFHKVTYIEAFEIVIEELANIYELTFIETIDLLGKGLSSYARQIRREGKQIDYKLTPPGDE